MFCPNGIKPASQACISQCDKYQSGCIEITDSPLAPEPSKHYTHDNLELTRDSTRAAYTGALPCQKELTSTQS
jgi:hypothetical protein